MVAGSYVLLPVLRLLNSKLTKRLKRCSGGGKIVLTYVFLQQWSLSLPLGHASPAGMALDRTLKGNLWEKYIYIEMLRQVYSFPSPCMLASSLPRSCPAFCCCQYDDGSNTRLGGRLANKANAPFSRGWRWERNRWSRMKMASFPGCCLASRHLQYSLT